VTIVGEDEQDTALLVEQANRARAYILGTGHWRSIETMSLARGVGGVVAVFLIHGEPAREDIDAKVWVVVGDVPPLYLVTHALPTASHALDAYIELRQQWVDAVRSGQPLDDLAPVDVEPTARWADALDRRLALLRQIADQWRVAD
jgi:hypothetical protein